jgi:hypothetical protein
MREKNKPGNVAPRKRNTISGPRKGMKSGQTNTSNDTGEINRGNTMNIGGNARSGELHTKKSVSGSDSDGQAE